MRGGSCRSGWRCRARHSARPSRTSRSSPRSLQPCIFSVVSSTLLTFPRTWVQVSTRCVPSSSDFVHWYFWRGTCLTVEYSFLLLEFCPYGNLKHFLVENRSKFESCLRNVPGHLESEFSAQLLLTWSYSIARGLEYLVSASIMHGDLAARNILVGENYVAKISDFGLSKMMYYNEGYKKTV